MTQRMAYWLVADPKSEWKVSQVGGKGFHLNELVRWGLQVPPFGVVTTSCFQSWEETGSFPKEALEKIQLFVAKYPGSFWAVRSSMTKEDGDEASFAGILESYLFVEPKDILQKIEECFRSIDSDRAKAYLKEKRLLDSPDLKVAVVVQCMVDSYASGVAFSRAPTGNSSLLYIEGGLGLGEGVVSGLVEVDSFWVDRFGEEWKRKICSKKSRVVYQPEKNQVALVEFQSEESDLPCLTREQILELSNVVLKIESKMQKPSDIEWTVDQHGKLFLLQTRAITQEFFPIEYYMDTNLCESYPGMVSPLTADFIPRIYTKVISEGLQTLGCTGSDWKRLQPALSRLIKDHGGHLYYHLRSYYEVLASLPGGKKNVDGWHQMIGGESRHGGDLDTIPVASGWTRVKANFQLLRVILRHHSVYKKFISEAFTHLDQLYLDLEHRKTPQEVASFIIQSIRETRGWGLTVINDFIVIIALKLIRGLFEKNNISEKYVADLLRTDSGVDSMKALEDLSTLSSEVTQNPDFALAVRSLVKNAPEGSELENAYLQLRKDGFSRQVDQMEAYLAQFGDRSFNELKLECMTFKQSPLDFLKLILWYAGTQGGNPRDSQKVSQGSAAKFLPWTTFGIRDQILLKWIKNLAEKSVQARESTRLMRGRYYGVIRSAVLRLGKLLKESDSERFGKYRLKDFFALDLKLIEEYSNGKLKEADLQSKVDQDREWESREVEYPEFFCHSKSDTQPYFMEASSSVVEIQTDPSKELNGTGASPGVIDGEVLVLKDPREAMSVPSLRDKILVTRSTDPAWIFIMSQCRGLVSEKGSLLSHTAIVGRELGIPTVVGVSSATKLLRTGDRISLDGERGSVVRSQALSS